MTLLFTDVTGNDELKELLGFLDADLKFKNLKSDIIEATNEVIQLIGQEMYDTAVTAYAKADNVKTQDEKDLIFAVRYPIAIQGYRTFAQTKDLAHTNKGRHTRIGENEQAAFEWMIVRDNKAMERKYYKSLDNLITYLDVKGGNAWKATGAFKATHDLFIRTTAEFDMHFPIGKSRLLLIKLASGIRQAEKRDIKPRIGAVLFDAMKTKLKVGDNVDDANLLLLIQEACTYKAMAWAMRRLSVQLFPEGVLQTFFSDRSTVIGKRPTLKSETEAAAQAFDQDAKQVLLNIESIITKLNYVEGDQEEVYPSYSKTDKYFST